MRTTIYSRALFVLAIALVFIWLVPVMWVVLTSVKPTNIINSAVPIFFDFDPTLDHYVEVFERFRFGRSMINSFVTVGVSTVIVMIITGKRLRDRSLNRPLVRKRIICLFSLLRHL